MGTGVATDALYNMAHLNPNVSFKHKVKLVLAAS